MNIFEIFIIKLFFIEKTIILNNFIQQKRFSQIFNNFTKCIYCANKYIVYVILFFFSKRNLIIINLIKSNDRVEM